MRYHRRDAINPVTVHSFPKSGDSALNAKLLRRDVYVLAGSARISVPRSSVPGETVLKTVPYF